MRVIFPPGERGGTRRKILYKNGYPDKQRPAGACGAHNHKEIRKGLNLSRDGIYISKGCLVYPAHLDSGVMQASTNARYHPLNIK